MLPHPNNATTHSFPRWTISLIKREHVVVLCQRPSIRTYDKKASSPSGPVVWESFSHSTIYSFYIFNIKKYHASRFSAYWAKYFGALKASVWYNKLISNGFINWHLLSNWIKNNSICYNYFKFYYKLQLQPYGWHTSEIVFV